MRDREIEVTLSDDEQVHIQYSENSKEYYDISVSDGNVLTMVNANNKEWTDYIGGKPSTKDRKIVLQMPTTLLDTVTLSTTNEDISLPVLAVTGSIDISTNDGNITFESLDVGNTLTLTVKNGDISGMIGSRYEDFVIQSEVKKGDSSLPKHKDIGKKTLKVLCNNGDVDVTFSKHCLCHDTGEIPHTFLSYMRVNFHREVSLTLFYFFFDFPVEYLDLSCHFCYNLLWVITPKTE